jgi:hypothetical protein
MTTLDNTATYRPTHRFERKIEASKRVGFSTTYLLLPRFRVHGENVSIDRGLYDDGCFLSRV